MPSCTAVVSFFIIYFFFIINLNCCFMLSQEIQLACEPGLQQQLEVLAHLIRHFVDDEVLADPEKPLLPMDSVRALQDLYLASMRAAFGVYLFYAGNVENRNNPA